VFELIAFDADDTLWHNETMFQATAKEFATLVIAALWTLAMVFYARDFRLGMVVLYSLSILHVMLEFPLDQKTFRSLSGELWAMARRTKPPVVAPAPTS
jgi:FMN phosphatase YigB (HAD superfamily)